MDLPAYGDRAAVAEALKQQNAVIVGKKAELEMEYTKLSAIRKMCDHEYHKQTFAGHYAGKWCEHCGDTRD